jgi:hypothetical protein
MECYLLSQKLARSETFRWLPDVLCLGDYADLGVLVDDGGLIPYIDGKDNA